MAALTLQGIKQFHVNVQFEDWKLQNLGFLCKILTTTRSVIFVNTRRTLDMLTEEMRSRRGFSVSAIHADVDESTRDVIVGEFNSGSTRVLITTDILPRGIDFQQVSVVVNYDLPALPEDYLHRVGRRAGVERKGVVINFLTQDDDRMIFDIQRIFNVVIAELPAGGVADLL